MAAVAVEQIDKVRQDYRKKCLEHKEVDSRLKDGGCFVNFFLLNFENFFGVVLNLTFA